jgi:hypothetical protein
LSARHSSMCGSRRLIRSCTTAKAVHSNMPCGIASSRSVGPKSR